MAQGQDIRAKFADLVATYPLYKKLHLDAAPDSWESILADKVMIRCFGCKMTMPFNRVLKGGGRRISLGDVSGGAYFVPFLRHREVEYKCANCEAYLMVWLEAGGKRSWFRKVGQSPPWEEACAPELTVNLGGDAELYEKGIRCLANSYGIGACAYLRRLVENQIDPMLRLLKKLKELEGASAVEIEELDALLKGKVFDAKIDGVRKLLPQSLIIDGENPVKLLHDNFSKSIHGLSDAQGVEVAESLAELTVFVLAELSTQVKAKENLAKAIRAAKKALPESGTSAGESG